MISQTPIGQMNRRMTIIQTAPGPLNELNETQPVQTAIGTIWAKLSPISGTERYINAQNISDVTHEIRCRWIARLNNTCTLQMNNRSFDLVSVLDIEDQQTELLILAHENK